MTKFNDTAFNQPIPFQITNTPAAHINLKPNAEHYARHTPAPVPYHWKEAIDEIPDKDAEQAIISLVPTETPTEYCVLPS